MAEYKIPRKEFSNVMTSFWTMMKECESVADNENDPVLKHQVEGWHRQWNMLTDSDNEPRWVTRNKVKDAATV